MEQGRPDYVAIEKVFVNVNPQSTLLLGQARGAAICAAVGRSLPVAEYTALQVKQAVVGNGHAKKEQVQEMVRRLLTLPGRSRHRCRRCACLCDLSRAWWNGAWFSGNMPDIVFAAGDWCDRKAHRNFCSRSNHR